MRIDRSSPDIVEHYARLAESVAEAGYISCEPSFERGYRQAARDAAEKIRASQPATPTGGETSFANVVLNGSGDVIADVAQPARSSAGSDVVEHVAQEFFKRLGPHDMVSRHEAQAIIRSIKPPSPTRRKGESDAERRI